MTPYNRDGNARRKNRIDALKGTVLQQSMVSGVLQENEPILP